MRVLLFNWRDARHPEAGGAERFLHATASRWAAQKHEITLICARPSTTSPREEWHNGLKIVRVGNRATLYTAAANEYRHRWRGWPDVIVEHINGIPFFTPLYAEEPIVAVLHHFVGPVFFREFSVPLGLLGYALESLVPLLYRDVPLVTVSPSTKDEAIRRGFPRSKVKVVYNGIDDPKPPLSLARRENRILYLGRLKRYKRLDLFVRAARRILKEIPDAKFVVAGRGNYETELRRLVERGGLREAFQIPGFVEEREKRRLFKTSKIVLYPSQREGWGLTILEAASYGVPTVAFDVPGIRDAVVSGRTGVLVPPRDPLALAQAAIGLLQDENLRRKMAREAMRFSDQFRWNLTARNLLVQLQTAANSRTK